MLPCRNLMLGEKSLMTRGHTRSFSRKLNSWCWVGHRRKWDSEDQTTIVIQGHITIKVYSYIALSFTISDVKIIYKHIRQNKRNA